MRPRLLLLTVAAGLTLADASVVTLALPDLLRELNTTVDGVAAVIGVYTVVLAAALVPAERLARRHGAGNVGSAGFALFAAASIVCALAGSLPVLLVARGIQALGGAAGLVATFSLLVHDLDDPGVRRRLWLGAAVLSSALGPALGGALTQAFSWQAIFITQVPIGALAAVAARNGPGPVAGEHTAEPDADSPTHFELRPSAALGLVSAALSAVLFLLVLLLVAGWNVKPLAAAGAVTVIPVAALLGARMAGDPRVRAAAGCALVGLGTMALAFLPDASLLWTLVPQALAGFGMGLALPALGGDLLPERNAGDAARLLTLRHAGIALALAVLAPITSAKLDDATFRARERGVALVLDAKLPPLSKVGLAPTLLTGVEDREPRAGLRTALREHRTEFDGADLVAYDHLAERMDETLITAVGEAFDIAFLITGGFALIAAAMVLPRTRWPAWAPAAVVAGVVAVGAQAGAHAAYAPDPVPIADPCKPRSQPGVGGITGALQDQALAELDRQSCRLGASREELFLALLDDKDAKRFAERHGTDPRSFTGVLGILGAFLRGLVGG